MVEPAEQLEAARERRPHDVARREHDQQQQADQEVDPEHVAERAGMTAARGRRAGEKKERAVDGEDDEQLPPTEHAVKRSKRERLSGTAGGRSVEA